MGDYTHHFIERTVERIGLTADQARLLARDAIKAIKAADESWCRFQCQHTPPIKIYRADIPQGRFWLVIDTQRWVALTVLTADQPLAYRRKGRMRKVMGGGYNGVRR